MTHLQRILQFRLTLTQTFLSKKTHLHFATVLNTIKLYCLHDMLIRNSYFKEQLFKNILPLQSRVDHVTINWVSVRFKLNRTIDLMYWSPSPYDAIHRYINYKKDIWSE